MTQAIKNVSTLFALMVIVFMAIFALIQIRKKQKTKGAYQEKIHNQSDLQLLYTLQVTILSLQDRLDDINKLLIPDLYKNTLLQPLIDNIAFLKSLKNNIENNHFGSFPIGNKTWQRYLEEAEYDMMDPSISLLPNYLHSLRAISHANVLGILGENNTLKINQEPTDSAMTGNPVMSAQFKEQLEKKLDKAQAKSALPLKQNLNQDIIDDLQQERQEWINKHKPQFPNDRYTGGLDI